MIKVKLKKELLNQNRKINKIKMIPNKKKKALKLLIRKRKKIIGGNLILMIMIKNKISLNRLRLNYRKLMMKIIQLVKNLKKKI